ncbi:hypothetical protein M9H77_16925 [Catharanthus roseus]|uniref:Uncharacterized protein n=1 Tax=Catharanthus roseus TaxID=4058 RepID=A0ACC0B3A2_CATRO|nr:hypothetical protein M9H77_16925 [Catharanthus roseus]
MSVSLKNQRVKRSAKRKEIVVLEESEEVNFYANDTNVFFASEFLCVQNFEDSSKDEGGKLAYKSIKTINFFPSYALSFDRKKKVEFVKHLQSKNHDALNANHMKFDLKRLVFDSGVVYMENASKIKLDGFKDQVKTSKLLSICTTRITQGSKLDMKWLSVGEEQPYRRW